MDKILSFFKENPLIVRTYIFLMGTLLLLWVFLKLFIEFGTGLCPMQQRYYCENNAENILELITPALIPLTVLFIFIAALFFLYKTLSDWGPEGSVSVTEWLEKFKKDPKRNRKIVKFILILLFLSFPSITYQYELATCLDFCGVFTLFFVLPIWSFVGFIIIIVYGIRKLIARKKDRPSELEVKSEPEQNPKETTADTSMDLDWVDDLDKKVDKEEEEVAEKKVVEEKRDKDSEDIKPAKGIWIQAIIALGLTFLTIAVSFFVWMLIALANFGIGGMTEPSPIESFFALLSITTMIFSPLVALYWLAKYGKLRDASSESMIAIVAIFLGLFLFITAYFFMQSTFFNSFRIIS